MKEAESYDGPSLIIAYAPCNEHHIKKGGLVNSSRQEKWAVECGYFNLLRYDPRKTDEGKNPLTVDSKEPNWDKFYEFLDSENRFSQLAKVNPGHKDELYAKCLADAKRRRARADAMAKDYEAAE